MSNRLQFTGHAGMQSAGMHTTPSLLSVIERAWICMAQRRLPFRRMRGESPVNRDWRRQLETALRADGMTKVGFGPIFSDEHDLHVRKWRIDPVVNEINRASDRYRAGIFFNDSDMERFDIAVVVRETAFLSPAGLQRARANGRKVVYDIVDRPYFPGDLEAGSGLIRLLEQVDGLITSSPLQTRDLGGSAKLVHLIEHPVLNAVRRNPGRNSGRGTVTIAWQGFKENQPRMRFIEPIVERLRSELDIDIILSYLTNSLPWRRGCARCGTWTVRNWESHLARSDIAVECKNLDDYLLQRKPATKVISYMAAGLPVICTPSHADRIVIEHGRTGYFAFNEDDWYRRLRDLVLNQETRDAMGDAAYDHVHGQFSLPAIAEKYEALFDTIRGGSRS